VAALPPSECRAEAGELAPLVDRSRCEGKAECVEVCPYHVFEVARIHDDDFAKLGLLAKLKSVAHGRKTAYTPRASACQACGKCVEACPEKAIKLTRVRPSQHNE
jgi:4Fe-4S ferredoxin